MNRIVILLLATILVATLVEADVYMSTCARMDVPILSKVAQGACITSCKFQNCGTGTCKKRQGRAVCMCSRCAKGGGEWPEIPSKGR